MKGGSGLVDRYGSHRKAIAAVYGFDRHALPESIIIIIITFCLYKNILY